MSDVSWTNDTLAMKIAVYSGSFNPLHIGHMAIMEYLTTDMDFDMVYLVVSPKNPLKDSISEESGRARFEAARKAVEKSGLKVRAEDIELDMAAPHYTIRTLDALKEREPENSFTLVMGADNLAQIGRWKDYARILKEYGVMVYPRKGYDMEKLKAGLLETDRDFRIQLTDAPMVDVSSTMIREMLAEGKDVSEYICR